MTPDKEAELFAKIDLLMMMVARLEGRVSDMPTARDFGRLEGRLEEMSARLPTVVGYTPPRTAAE